MLMPEEAFLLSRQEIEIVGIKYALGSKVKVGDKKSKHWDQSPNSLAESELRAGMGRLACPYGASRTIPQPKENLVVVWIEILPQIGLMLWTQQAYQSQSKWYPGILI
jgi:hypothetical protein